MREMRDAAAAVAAERLDSCYGGGTCDWPRFYTPRMERANFASRYHLVYPGLGYFIQIRRDPARAARLRPQLDNMYRGLLEPRCWRYWHDELGETGWPLQERNLTYAGRLATFIGFYIDAFGAPPAPRIELDGRSTTYRDLSHSLWEQMRASPNCGVSCYNHESMVMCNAHMLINNRLHDRLYGTGYAAANDAWLATVDTNLTVGGDTGPLFFFGTQPNDTAPIPKNRALGADIWSLFLMSAVVPDRVRTWFAAWRDNIIEEGETAHVAVADWERDAEFSSDELASAWAFCLAQELGDAELAQRLARYFAPRVLEGSERDPYISGLYLLGHHLEPGAFRRLVAGA